jgi:ATP-binding cassette subfamily B protein
MAFIFYRQLNAMDCGPTCLRMIARYYGRHYNAATLRQQAGYSKEGVSLLGICETAEKIGFRTQGMKLTFNQLQQVALPCILHWDQNHFVVLISISHNSVKIADPREGILQYHPSEMLPHWLPDEAGDGEPLGVALLLEPTALFYEAKGEKEHSLNGRLLLQYLGESKAKIAWVFITLLIASLLQLLVPFTAQSVVDKGIHTKNLQLVAVILVAQLVLTLSQTVVGFIRSRLLLRISNILNLKILSNFWLKLTRLPLAYFDVHQTGDTLQRMSDHKQVQTFLTDSTLNALFAVFNFAVYAVVLMIYNSQLFFIFMAGSLLYFFWVSSFLRIRRKINYQSFHLSAKENNASLQLIQGMQEIRMNNAGKQKRGEWENIQAALFRLNTKVLTYSQWQTSGATILNQVQNIVISFIAAKLVIDARLTLGAMIAIQYIIGQLSGPVAQWVAFAQSAQDAKISLERLNEVHQLPEEQTPGKTYISQLPDNKSIQLSNLSFKYPGAGNELVLKNIQLYIPQEKVTAIVGNSGSGKTTLLKILMKVYEQYDGAIKVGAGGDIISFEDIDHEKWRSVCGAVMQDGYIFNDTIARNIAVGEDDINYKLLVKSCKTANIHDFIESMPNGFTTQLGSEGIGLSQGQKQRLLIARAIYKDPDYLFFDEATNALDANNEREIVDNLEKFFRGKTVVIVAHRLSTVRHADHIVVLHKGKMVEEGTHEYLSSIRGRYYELVKNQLELGV